MAICNRYNEQFNGIVIFFFDVYRVDLQSYFIITARKNTEVRMFDNGWAITRNKHKF